MQPSNSASEKITAQGNSGLALLILKKLFIHQATIKNRADMGYKRSKVRSERSSTLQPYSVVFEE
ncbi:MAG: hypothetical protein VX777_10100 [Chlamydiota bacterium]|nr:hypothetical protein [Chlamydiota bacterium]